jgi:hypothetical protein
MDRSHFRGRQPKQEKRPLPPDIQFPPRQRIAYSHPANVETLRAVAEYVRFPVSERQAGVIHDGFAAQSVNKRFD